MHASHFLVCHIKGSTEPALVVIMLGMALQDMQIPSEFYSAKTLVFKEQYSKVSTHANPHNNNTATA